jgi:hypothetical protein
MAGKHGTTLRWERREAGKQKKRDAREPFEQKSAAMEVVAVIGWRTKKKSGGMTHDALQDAPTRSNLSLDFRWMGCLLWSRRPARPPSHLTM